MAKKGTTKYKSNLQEKSVAKQFGGKRVIASGALWFASSDVRNDKFLIECKTTSKDFYRVTTKVWEKISKEAVKDGLRIPLLIVDLKDSERYVVFNPSDFDRKFTSYKYTYQLSTKSYSLRKWENIDEVPLMFMLEAIHSPFKSHVLMTWTFDQFIDYFEGEL